MIFKDRADAGRQLADALPDVEPDKTVVVALPRGGVPVAREICAAHGLPMDIVLVRKIGAPHQPELAVGAVTDGDTPEVTVNDDVARHLRLSREDVEAMGRALLPEIERRRATYLGGLARQDMAGKTLIVVDDGIATGATLVASLKALKARHPSRIIVAVPTGPRDLAQRLDGLADTVICLSDLVYGAVGGAYRSFAQVDDRTVIDILREYGTPD